MQRVFPNLVSRVFLIAFVSFLVVACGSDSTTTTPSPTAQATATATSQPTPSPTPKPSPTATPTPTKTVAAAILGADISAFIAKFGQPNPNSSFNSGGGYGFQTYAGTKLDYVDVVVNGKDAAPFNTHVLTIIVNAPPKADWDPATATTICRSFGPTDVDYAKPVKEIPLMNGSDVTGIQRVYISVSLASAVATNEFVDANINAVTPGTFNISLEYDGNPNKIGSCTLEVGIQG